MPGTDPILRISSPLERAQNRILDDLSVGRIDEKEAARRFASLHQIMKHETRRE